MSLRPLEFGLHRTHNLRVLHAHTGEIVSSTRLVPTGWHLDQFGNAPNPSYRWHLIEGSQVVPIANTDDVAVLLWRGGIDGLSICQQAIMRVTPCGCIKWERHWNYPLGSHPNAPLGLISRKQTVGGTDENANGLAALPSGLIAVLAGTQYVLTLDPADGTTSWSRTIANNSSRGRALLPIPNQSTLRMSGEMTDVSAGGIVESLGDGEFGAVTPASPPDQPETQIARYGWPHLNLCVLPSGLTVCAESWPTISWDTYRYIIPDYDFLYAPTWNATLNQPPLMSGQVGSYAYYKVAVAGGTILDGLSPWSVGDKLYFDFLYRQWFRWTSGRIEEATIMYLGRRGLSLRQPSANGWNPALDQGPENDDGLIAIHMPGITPAPGQPSQPPVGYHTLNVVNAATYDASDPPFVVRQAATSTDRIYAATRDHSRLGTFLPALRGYDHSLTLLWELPATAIDDLCADDSSVYAVGSNGVMAVSKDGVTRWSQMFDWPGTSGGLSCCRHGDYLFVGGKESRV